MTNSKMSLWSIVSNMPPEQFDSLFQEFPRSLRCLLGDWLENEPWEFINNSDPFCVALANRLLTAMVEKVQDLANKTPEAGLILHIIANVENRYRREPLKLVGIMKRILEAEQAAVQQFQNVPLCFQRQREELMFRFHLQKLQYRVHEIRESIKQMSGSVRDSLKRNTLEPTFSAQENPQANTLQNLQNLFLKTVSELEGATKFLLSRLQIWKTQQQLAGNGAPFDEDLAPLQKRFESLVEVCFQLRLSLIASEIELNTELRGRLDKIFTALIKNSFLVDKQPPQVLKTQTKFQATVRFLLGPLLLKSPQTFMVSADIVTEKQARELATGHAETALSESSGEIVNSAAPLETNVTSNSCCALFKNMLLKKIKRCDRKSTESVTEEKCAVLFTANINLGASEGNFCLQALSLPIVVIVHGNQDNNAKATILWDNAFAAYNRIPFMVAERVNWEAMCNTLNQKFMAEVQTTRGLCKEHYFFLAQKIFGDSGASPEDFQQRQVSWSQFNKEILPGRTFTFWQWFEGVLDLTKKYLRDYWSDGLIMGFINKQFVSNCLSNAPVGTFLLRFSDSEIGGISIAYVTRLQDGSTQVENIQPFTAKQLSIRSLADCVLDLLQLETLFPDKPKHEAFRKHFNTEPPRRNHKEYIQAKLKLTVEDKSCTLPLPSIQTPVEPMGNLSMNPGVISDPAYHEPPVTVSPSADLSSSGGTTYGSSFTCMPYPHTLENVSPLGPVDPYPLGQDEEMYDICLPSEGPLTYPGDLQFSAPLRVPENISSPSEEELTELLNPDQQLDHFYQNLG